MSKLLRESLFFVSLYLLLNLFKGVIITGRIKTFLLFFVDMFPTDVSFLILLCVLKFFIEFTFDVLFSFVFNSLFSFDSLFSLFAFFSDGCIDFLKLPDSIAFLLFIFKYLLSYSSIVVINTSLIIF